MGGEGVHKVLAGGDLGQLDVFVRGVALVHAARTEHHGVDTGTLEQAGLGSVDDGLLGGVAGELLCQFEGGARTFRAQPGDGAQWDQHNAGGGVFLLDLGLQRLHVVADPANDCVRVDAADGPELEFEIAPFATVFTAAPPATVPTLAGA